MKKPLAFSLLTLLLLLALVPAARTQVTNAVTRALLKGGSREVQVGPTGSIDGYSASTLPNALTYAISQATAANPYTVRLLPGVYSLSATLDFNSANGVNLVGAGRGVTTIIASASLLSSLDANGGAPVSLVFSTKLSIQHLTIDAVTNAQASYVDGLWNGNAIDTGDIGDVLLADIDVKGASSGILSTNQTNPASLEMRDCFITASGYGLWQTGNQKVTIYNSRIEAKHNATTFDNGFTTQNSGMQVDTIATHDITAIGSYFYAEDTVNPSRLTSGIFYQSQNSASRLTLIGSVAEGKTTTDLSSSTYSIGGLILHTDASTAGTVSFVGSVAILTTPSSQSKGAAGGIVWGSAPSTEILEIVGSQFLDLGGDLTGNFARSALTQENLCCGAAGGKVRVIGSHFPSGPTGESAIASNVGEGWGFPSGNATLASGIKKIALVTNAGNQGGATKTFTGGGTSVTGGTTFTTQFKQGDYVRANGHADDCWTQISTLTDSTLTLKEGYRCANATAIPQKGTINAQTQSDTNYRVVITPTAAPAASELFYITNKHASGFTINSSSGASTLTLDWIVVR